VELETEITLAAMEALVAGLGSQGWAVRERGGNRAGSPTGDLVVTAPDGRVYLVAVEGGNGSLHFGAVARLERSARLLAAQEERDVVPVLVTGQAVSAKIAGIASGAGVRVVAAAGASSREAAGALIRFLREEAGPCRG